MRDELEPDEPAGAGAADPAATGGPARDRGRRRLTWTAAGGAAAAVVLVIAGVSIAVAQTSSTTTTTTVPSPGPAGKPGRYGRGGFGPLGPMGKLGGFGPNGIIHGEFVRPNGNNAYQTVDVQTGQVTSVSTSSITLKSADGFSKTYAVTTNTLVDAGRDGIGSVKKGDMAQLTAVVNGSTAEARNINDITNLAAIHQHWRPSGPGAPASSGTSST